MLDDGLFPRDEVPARPGPSGGAESSQADQPQHQHQPRPPLQPTDGVGEHRSATLVERLSAPVSLRLVILLASLEPAQLTAIELETAAEAWARLEAACGAGQTSMVGEMLRRAPVGGPGSREFLGSELAAVLGTSRRAGEKLADRAELCERSPQVWDAMAAGEISAAKVDALAATTGHLPDPVAAAVVGEVLPQAPTLTPAGVRNAARRAEVAVDPAAAEDRLARARRGRCVWVEPAPESMAWIKAYLPAGDAMAVMTSLDSWAAGAGQEDRRGIDARRADAFVDLLTAGTLARPGGWTGSSQVAGQGFAVGAAAEAEHDAEPAAARRGRGRSGGRGRAGAAVTVSLQTLTGLRDGGGDLTGYGPVPSSIAREVAADGTWRLLATDGAGQVTLASTRAYRPTETIAATVLARDVTCTFPGCRTQAVSCDLDHTVPYEPGRAASDGSSAHQTHPDNLAALCRHHHRMKTLGGWSTSRDPATGVVTWVSRTGRTYTRDPYPVPHDPPDPTPRAMRAAEQRASGAIGSAADGERPRETREEPPDDVIPF